MRKVLFRGKRIDNGEWIEGSLIQRDLGCFIVDESNRQSLRYCSEFVFAFDCLLVKSETVGQYTGLVDKNGKRIFEGDIVDVEYNADYVGVAAERIGLFVVVFDNGCFMKKKINGGGMYHFIGSDVCRVVANATDNPELLNPSFKPEYRDGDPDSPICPNCRMPLNEMENCDCGQKIDWSEE